MKINGVVIENETTKKERTPTINQILDNMENNFQMVNSKQKFAEGFSGQFSEQKDNQTFAQSFLGKKNGEQNYSLNQEVKAESFNNQNFQHDDKNNLLLSILPTLLSQNKSPKNLNKQKEMLIGELLKNSSNPMLSKLFKLLPQLANKTDVLKNEENSKESAPQKTEPKIDSFRKTVDFEE